jgi:hypothetical protein
VCVDIHRVQSNSAVAVAETVQHFITAMDSLKLNMVAVDQVSQKMCWNFFFCFASCC